VVDSASRAPSAVSSGAGLVARSSSGTGLVAQVVERPVARDGGDPAAEVVVVTGKGGEVAGDLEPGFRGDILGVVADQRVQVAQQAGLGVAVHGAERLRIAPLRPDDCTAQSRLVRIRAGGRIRLDPPDRTIS
jgi:hypothetical protein